MIEKMQKITVKWKLLQKDIFDALKYFGGIDVRDYVCIVDILDDHDVVKLIGLLAGLESLRTSKGWATCSFRYYKGRLYDPWPMFLSLIILFIGLLKIFNNLIMKHHETSVKFKITFIIGCT